MAITHRRASCEPSSRIRENARDGFSLTELLVAMTIALMVMAAIASLFGVFGRTVSQSQATVELAGKLRATAWQMRQDLAGVTVPLVPWVTPESNEGYFELIEGPQRDTTLAIISGSTTANLEGDTDDVLLFTTRAVGGPFVGRYNTKTIESDCAEVAWFCREAGNQPVAGTKLYNLHRRQLIVMGYPGTSDFGVTNSIPGTLPNTSYDISFRANGTALLPNCLGDLTKRENRFLRNGVFTYINSSSATVTVSSTAFPYAFPLDPTTRRPIVHATFDNVPGREWEDVVLTNVIAFDVRVFDPAAVVRITSGSVSMFPGDPGYETGAITSSTSTGAYADLGWGRMMMTGTMVSGTATATISGTRVPVAISGTFPPSGTTAFQSDGVAVRNSAVINPTPEATYDTWSLHYEFNGLDDDGDGIIDEGTNGLNDNDDGVPDDPAEYETSPPYPVPLRGIEVRIRCYEPTSKQIRQITVRHTFVKK